MLRLPGARRLGGFLVDYGLVLTYLVLLFAVVQAFWLASTGHLAEMSSPYHPVRAQLLGFVSVTVPVVTYFAVCEWRRGMTVGRRTAGLRVAGPTGIRPTLGRAVARNAVKFAPWEMAHFCVHQMIAAGVNKIQAPGYLWLLLGFVYAVIGVYFVTALMDWTAPYDRLARTRVTEGTRRTMLRRRSRRGPSDPASAK